MQSQLVSVIIPVYNVANYVEIAIRSIMEQTYTNLEIIIVDDCSTDATYSIICDLASIDNRIKLFKNDVNKKIANTLNTALSHASGEYIARMDGDDISMTDRIAVLVAYLTKYLDIDLVGSSMTAIDSEGKILHKTTHYSDEALLDKTLKYVTPLSHIWLARRSVYDKLNGYRNLSGVEDYDFLLRMKTLGLKFTNISDYYGYYVRLGRAGNTISTMGIRQLKLKSYAYKLYCMRKRNATDSFSLDELEKHTRYSHLISNLHNFSAKHLYKAIESSSKKKTICFLWHSGLSLVSPYQVMYLMSRLIYKLTLRSYS